MYIYDIYIYIYIYILLILLSLLLLLLLLFVLVILLLLLSLNLRHLFYPDFNVIVVVSILPKVEPCTTCTFYDLVPCSIGI